MRSYVEESKFPGSTFLLAEGGNIVHRASTGYRAIDEGKPFEEDTIVRIYSMTKPVVSVGLMMLAERGLFHLDAPVSDFLPEFAECRALTGGAGDETAPCPAPTLHQLLTHTSGLTYAFNPGPAAAAYAAARIDFRPNGPGLAEMTRKLAELPLAFAPGTRWEYSVGIDVVGRVIEAVTGQPLDTWLEAEILEPLGMTDTGFAIPDNKVDRLATLYTSLESGAPISLAAAGKGVMRQVETAEDSAWRGAKTFSGGGGLLSTIDDYFAFTEMLRKGGAHNGARLLSPATLAFMRRNHLPGDIASMGPSSFAETPTTGIGFGIGGSVVLDPALTRAPGNVGDFSWGGIASTVFWLDPAFDLTAIFLTQLTPSSSYPARPQLKALVHGARL
ncbi:beta-lactamase family protein [Pikeienuella piscinae]|uniref:Beta-lactamase family protein n=2 Tax=Pikeienuella piscinae TaxID=2748098 RepID=A0A7M3T6Q8_9RHOB|nr:beta-lactamase family protein [Pikeienuella piscinae]